MSVHFGDPYPDGHYDLVVMDKRTRYPEVEVVYLTGTKPTKEKLKKIFATHGTPIQVERDNGPLFQTKEFAEFAAVEGFRHHIITPLHPRVNGETEFHENGKQNRTDSTDSEKLTNDGNAKGVYSLSVDTTPRDRNPTKA